MILEPFSIYKKIFDYMVDCQVLSFQKAFTGKIVTGIIIYLLFFVIIIPIIVIIPNIYITFFGIISIVICLIFGIITFKDIGENILSIIISWYELLKNFILVIVSIFSKSVRTKFSSYILTKQYNGGEDPWPFN